MNAPGNLNNENTKKWYKKWWGVLLVIFIILVLSFILAFTFSVVRIKSDMNKSEFQGNNYYRIQDVDKLNLIEGNSTSTESSNYWLGTDKPKLTIVEFADFGCPRCKSSFPKIREATSLYKDEIKYIFRDYPIISSYSLDMAMAARCAGEQGLFWVMHDRLYLNDIQSKYDILKIAQGIGMDYDKLVTCLDQQKYLPDIKKDIDAANKLELTGTPTWFVNGNEIDGDMPYEFLFGLINKLLK
jgi:protein-disulfide isomerase